MPDRIIHTRDGQRLSVGHGDDCVLVVADEWSCVLTSEQAHRLATALHVQADLSEEGESDADA